MEWKERWLYHKKRTVSRKFYVISLRATWPNQQKFPIQQVVRSRIERASESEIKIEERRANKLSFIVLLSAQKHSLSLFLQPSFSHLILSHYFATSAPALSAAPSALCRLITTLASCHLLLQLSVLFPSPICCSNYHFFFFSFYRCYCRCYSNFIV